MLTVGQVSGLIAAAVTIVQIILPAALVLIIVYCVGTKSSAVTWSVVNRAISRTLWPHFVRADSVSSRHVQFSVQLLSWVGAIGVVLLAVAGIVAPLGLHDTIVAGDAEPVDFRYIRDPGPWGKVTMSRPNMKFSRHCELGRRINCPGQFQGVVMNETGRGSFQSVELYEGATVNQTIPRNFTEMFSSATSNKGDTISGLFDIQYRFWTLDRWGVIEKGAPFVRGISQYVENLITQYERPLLKEGLIIDMTAENPGIGFRNHTAPIGLDHGGTWSEDITWLEAVTQCADTNLTIELRTENNVEDITDKRQLFIVDRGAFADLDDTVLETPPWIDNQTLDLFGRAHKAARMHNFLVADALKVSLPLSPSMKTIPKLAVEENSKPLNYLDFEAVLLQPLNEGLTGIARPNISEKADFVNYYPDGTVKLRAMNYTAIEQICRGYYRFTEFGRDLRNNNITNTAVQCGYVFGAPSSTSSDKAAAYKINQTQQKNMYICASGVKATIKTVEFRYNGTEDVFSNLEVLRIEDKTYPNNKSKPVWAVETSGDYAMWFDPLWGIVDKRYENFEGFHTLQSEKLWLPATPFMVQNIGASTGYDSLAGVSGIQRWLGQIYGDSILAFASRDYTGKYEAALLDRFRQLSGDAASASRIPSLILTDGLAGGLVGTKTSFSSKYAEWPASLAVDDRIRGLPRAKVVVYQRALGYNLRYAIPAVLVLALFTVILFAAAIVLLLSPSIISTIRNVYNQTSAGRLATNLLRPGQSDPKEASQHWVKGPGTLQLSFGQISRPEENHFCKIAEASPNPQFGSGTGPVPAKWGHPVSVNEAQYRSGHP